MKISYLLNIFNPYGYCYENGNWFPTLNDKMIEHVVNLYANA